MIKEKDNKIKISLELDAGPVEFILGETVRIVYNNTYKKHTEKCDVQIVGLDFENNTVRLWHINDEGDKYALCDINIKNINHIYMT